MLKLRRGQNQDKLIEDFALAIYCITNFKGANIFQGELKASMPLPLMEKLIYT